MWAEGAWAESAWGEEAWREGAWGEEALAGGKEDGRGLELAERFCKKRPLSAGFALWFEIAESTRAHALRSLRLV